MKKNLVIPILAISMLFVGCGNNSTAQSNSNTTSQVSEQAQTNNQTENKKVDFSNFSTAMVSDIGGINDKSFNQNSYDGFKRLNQDTGAKISYKESQQLSDYKVHFDALRDENVNLIWGIGYLLSSDVVNAAAMNPDQLYGIIDTDLDGKVPNNVIAVDFEDQEAAFLAGYIAANVTKTDKVGFIGGIPGRVISRFEYGYKAGVDYAARELNKKIGIETKYINSFVDDSMGKASALAMYNQGADIIYHASGNAGQGVIEAAKELNKLAIGVDMDQSYLAPKNVLTSTVKRTGDAVYDASYKTASGEHLGGQVLRYGLAKHGVSLADPNENTFNLMPKELYEKATKDIEEMIVSGKIKVPKDEKAYEKFVSEL